MASVRGIEHSVKRSFSHVKDDIEDIKRAQTVQRDVIKKELMQLRDVSKAMREELRYNIKETEAAFAKKDVAEELVKKLDSANTKLDIADELRHDITYLKSSMLTKETTDDIMVELHNLKESILSLDSDAVRQQVFERRIGSFEGRLKKITRKAQLRDSFARETKHLKDLKRRVHDIEQRMVTSLDVNKEFSVRENRLKKAVAKELFEMETMVGTLAKVSDDLKKDFVGRKEFENSGKELSKRITKLTSLNRKISLLNEKVAGMKDMFVREDQHERRIGTIEKEINLVVEDIESLEKVHKGFDIVERISQDLVDLTDRIRLLEGKSATKGELARNVHRMRDSLDHLKEQMESEVGIETDEKPTDVKDIRKLDEFFVEKKKLQREGKGFFSKVITFFDEPEKKAKAIQPKKTKAPTTKKRTPKKKAVKRSAPKQKGTKKPAKRKTISIPKPKYSKKKPLYNNIPK